MKRKSDRLRRFLFLFSTASFFFAQLKAQKSYDSLNLKPPRHYFNSIIVLDVYGRGSSKLDTVKDALSKKLESYALKQFNLSFQVPLITRDYKGIGADSNRIENIHLMLTGNFLTLKPVFGGIEQHTLTKRGVGIRFIYNTGKKGVWFFDAAPFVTRDITYTSRAYTRMASTVVYSHNTNDYFNWRLGLTKSFLWGNRLYLPFIGLRVGKLDGLNFSIQFPRNISVNLPLGSGFRLSLFSRAQGGMFNFSNRDTLYPKSTEATFHFTRYEINTGFRFDVKVGSRVALFVSSGFSTKNNITFYSDKANQNRPRSSYKVYFYDKDVRPSLFGQLGLVIKLGKTRSYYGNRNIYDAIDLNNTMDVESGNIQIPTAPKKTPRNLNLESVQDLVDYNDF